MCGGKHRIKRSVQKIKNKRIFTIWGWIDPVGNHSTRPFLLFYVTHEYFVILGNTEYSFTEELIESFWSHTSTVTPHNTTEKET